MQKKIENHDLKSGFDIQKGAVVAFFFLTSVLTVYFLILALVGFQIDITGIKPGAVVNYNPNTGAAFIVLAFSLSFLIISGILYKLILRMNQAVINAFVFPVSIFTLIWGAIAAAVNIYLIIKISIKGIFWPYILFLMIKNPGTLSGQLFFLHDFRNFTNICFYMYLFITIVTPGLSFLLVKFKSLTVSKNRLSNDAGIWLIMAILFPYLMIPLSLKGKQKIVKKLNGDVSYPKRSAASNDLKLETGGNTRSPASPAVKSLKLTEQGDAARGVSVLLVALRWDSNPISKQELRDRAAKAVQVVDGQFDKDVMDVKILVIDESQQYVQLSVRADFRDKAEEERMRESLKKEFIQ